MGLDWDGSSVPVHISLKAEIFLSLAVLFQLSPAWVVGSVRFLFHHSDSASATFHPFSRARGVTD